MITRPISPKPCDSLDPLLGGRWAGSDPLGLKGVRGLHLQVITYKRGEVMPWCQKKLIKFPWSVSTQSPQGPRRQVLVPSTKELACARPALWAGALGRLFPFSGPQ